MIFVLAILGALTVFCAVVVGCAFLLASLLPSESIQVRTPEPLMVPLVPAVWRRKQPDKTWNRWR